MAHSDGERAYLRAFGKRVCKARLARGWTQEELADKADMDRTYIGGIERGERNVALLNLNKLALALGEPAVRLVPRRIPPS
jgi:transcriptional regulator with XRE-family HTH domain